MANADSIAFIPLPKDWNARIRSAVLHVIGLARLAMAYTRSWAANSPSVRLRLQAENERLTQEAALLREELRIKDARLARIPPAKRPYYPPHERMAILELRAARGWSLAQTARAFLLTAATIADWMKRLDESGPNALVQLREPVNKFPDFVRYLVQTLKRVCPFLGKAKIAQFLARAGLHLGVTTVGRILKERPRKKPSLTTKGKKSRVTSKRPNHLWHVDLTCVPTLGGFWVPWLPGAIAQRSPFCWWVGVVLDHFSRRALGVAVFDKQPTANEVQAFLARTVRKVGRAPKHLVCDQGEQFVAPTFRAWCKKTGIRLRYGALGQHGSIAVIERFHLTLKTEGLRGLLVPLRKRAFEETLLSFLGWYNGFRPHTTLGGCTPNEIYFRRSHANRRPRREPRKRWPRGSPCARPQAPPKGRRGAKFEIGLRFHAGRKELPIVTLRKAA